MEAKIRSLEDAKQLTDVGAINRLLQETITRERSISSELESMLVQRQVVEGRLVDVHLSSEVLELVRADSEQMTSSITTTCNLAERVSSKVRELDLAQTRVTDTIARITTIVERSNCVDGLKSAMDGEDYEQAAKYIETFLQLDATYLEDHVSTDTMEGAQAESHRKMLREAKEKLEEVVRTRFKEAADKRDHKSAVRFARLYSPLGLAEEGLLNFCGYIRSLVAMRAKEDYQALSKVLERPTTLEEQEEADFCGALTNVFQDIATALEQNEELLTTAFGPKAMVRAALEMHKECDTHGSLVIKRFAEFRNLKRLAHDIGRKGSSSNVELPDPRAVESYLEELLMICQRSEEYSNFLLDKMKDEADQAVSSPVNLVNSFKTGTFNLAVQELIGYYITMEEYYMNENVLKAVAIDEMAPGQLTSSMVDDVFYILQKCARRTLGASSVQCVCAGLNNVNNILGAQYMQALASRLRGGPGRLVQGLAVPSPLPGAATPVKTPGLEHAVAVNGCDISAEYVVKLRRELEGYVGDVFSAPHERERIKACLADLSETSAAFRQMSNTALEQLAQSLGPRLKPTLDAFQQASYELSEQEYAANELEDSWAQALVQIVETIVVQGLEPLLTAANYDVLVQQVVDAVVMRLEALVLQKRFNQLGGLQLEREMRQLVQQFAAVTSRSVRDKCARLTQMATILNLEAVGEMLDYWGDNAPGMTWRLTPAEVRRVLALRVEFKAEQISALLL